jgi:hypothetical protein
VTALRIANASGFYGDRLAAMRDIVEGGPVDVVTGDYLAGGWGIAAALAEGAGS